MDEIRPTYWFNETCQNTVPQAIIAFLESESYEDAIRNAVSLGSDSDTLAVITGAIAWSYYRFNSVLSDMETCEKESRIWTDYCDKIITEYGIDNLLPDEFIATIEQFDIVRMQRTGTYDRTGFWSPIKIE